MRRYLDKFPTAAAPSTHFQPSKELSRGSTHNLDCWCKYQHEPKPTSSWFSDPSMMKNHQQWLERGVRTILPHYQDCLAGPSPVKWLCILRSHRLLPFVFFFSVKTMTLTFSCGNISRTYPGHSVGHKDFQISTASVSLESRVQSLDPNHKNAWTAISRKQHFRSPKRKT